MLIDLATTELPESFSDPADLCIVGAGPAGIALARKLIGQDKKVVLLESGGFDYEPEVSALNAGTNVGVPYYDLEDSRLRFFGGTAAIWGGRCVELDDIDFEPREWVRYSGWPFPKSALTSYYADARELLHIASRPLDERMWRELGVQPPHFARGVVREEFWQFDDAWDRFGIGTHADLLRHPDFTVLLHASVTQLNLDDSGAAIRSVSVRSLGGRESRIHARAFVLAAGGIENPRLLLASRSSRAPEGIGNEHDVVGRYFMEHPHARGGRLHVHDLWKTLRAFRSSHTLDGSRYAACLRVDDALQRRREILNTSFTPRVRRHADDSAGLSTLLYHSIKDRTAPTQNARALWRMTRGAKRFMHRVSDPLKPWLNVMSGRRGLYLSVRAEQAPNPDSRIRLTGECDALGMPRVELDWRFSEIDKRTVRVLVSEIDAQLRREGAGSAEAAPWLADGGVSWENDTLIGSHAIGGYHHIGTTRMATDPRFGVVDAHCRVHGVANLYMAGSSVFPTSGWANPTLTILALSLRLGDHLVDLLERVPQVRTSVRTPEPPQALAA